MWILLFGLTSGLVASSCASLVQEVKTRSCSYVGVFHIQGNDRYTLNFTDAQTLCEALGASLASNEHMARALNAGLETCRYGWVSSGNVTIPRLVANSLCASNLTGLITLTPVESHYDAYCYDEKDLSDKNCTFEIKYFVTDPELPKTTEDTQIQEFNHSQSSDNASVTEPPEELHTNSTTAAVTEPIPTVEKTTPTLNNTLYEEPDVSGDVLNQTTQPLTTTSEPAKNDGNQSVFLDQGEPGEVIVEHTTIITTLDSFGSGMGETPSVTTSEPDTGDSKDPPEDHNTDGGNSTSSESPTAPPTEDKPVNSNQSVQPRGRTGKDVSPPRPESSSKSSKDWLVILIVLGAIAAIIILAILVVTRNRWCGKSQTLMITSKSSSEGNGTAASAASPHDQEREQEMVTLMNKEKIQENGNTEEFTVITLEESPEKNQEA